jgi:hypothetical protein
MTAVFSRFAPLRRNLGLGPSSPLRPTPVSASSFDSHFDLIASQSDADLATVERLFTSAVRLRILQGF